MIFTLGFSIQPLFAGEGQGLLLRAYVPSVFKVAFKERQFKKEIAEYSLVTESNTLRTEENHKIEIENPMGLEVDLKLLTLGSNESKKEYKFVVKNNQQQTLKNPILILKISAN